MKTFDLDAGVDALSFANTLDNRSDDEAREESLVDYADLVAFAIQTEQVDEAEARVLRGLALQRAGEAQAVLRRAIAAREAIFRLFSAVAARREPDDADLAILNSELSSAMAQSRLVAGDQGVEWVWRSDPAALDRPLWPVVRSAAELLTSEDIDRVRECAAHDCSWLFLDESRNRSRRWCNMQTCGNRAKVDRFRARRRGTEIVDAVD